MNPNQISDYHNGILDDLHKPYKKYKKWLMKANELLQLIQVTGPCPNRESLHFMVAQKWPMQSQEFKVIKDRRNIIWGKLF